MNAFMPFPPVKGASRIGAYILRSGEAPGTITIHHESGEGGEFPVADLESVISAYYEESF